MEVALSRQAAAFLWSLVLGAALGVLYDWFRIGRILRRKGRFTVLLEDLLFSFLAAVSTAWCFTLTNYGQVRLFLLVGEAMGFLIYFTTVGAVVTRFFKWFRRIIEKIMNFLKKPFIFLLEWCKIILHDYVRRFLRAAFRFHKTEQTQKSKADEPRG
ncbi:MAG: spore cortex biosynthesis protein YabQ [Clostridia bacterium]|nr:spore cortex biosynthesis protein YabQ [Clostridia bacterium]